MAMEKYGGTILAKSKKLRYVFLERERESSSKRFVQQKIITDRFHIYMILTCDDGLLIFFLFFSISALRKRAGASGILMAFTCYYQKLKWNKQRLKRMLKYLHILIFLTGHDLWQLHEFESDQSTNTKFAANASGFSGMCGC